VRSRTEALLPQYGGVQIADAIAQAFIAALQALKTDGDTPAAARLEAESQAALSNGDLLWTVQARTANSQNAAYRAVDPDNRLVARVSSEIGENA